LDRSPNSDATTHGKLTLRKIYFTYSNSNKAKFSSYNFYYAGETTSGGAMNSELNPDYNAMAYDRWGTYKPNNGASTWSYNSTSLSNSENPYTPQDKNLADKYAAVWALSAIRLPSGGFIQIEYEADDYAYVQDKDAMRMMEIVGTSSTIGSPNIDIDIQNSSPGAVIISDQSSADVEFQFNRYIIFNLQKKKINGQETSEYDEDIQHYFNDDKFVFVKALIQFRLKNTNEEFYELELGVVLDIVLDDKHPIFNRGTNLHSTIDAERWPADLEGKIALRTDKDLTWIGRDLIRPVNS
jgi:hypothetical protein